jgi:signal peptidase I
MKGFPVALYRVSGQSMTPAYEPGDTVVGWKWFKPKVGDVVIVQFDRPRIKRVKQVLADGVWVEGDNPDNSSDSRTLGTVPWRNVLAKAIAKF